MNSCVLKFEFRERGYILLVMLLMVALLSLGLLAAIERIDFQVKRDREEELIHRGVQYSRAVRRFVKKFGRYPESIEELENTSNFRSLRRRYKDPITGKDFKILHTADLYSTNANSLGIPAASLAAPQSSGHARQNATSAAAGTQSAANQVDTSSSDQTAGPEVGQSDSTNPDQTISNGSDVPPPAGSNGPLVAVGPMVGVVSTSHQKSIREFNKQDHYNLWKFTYNPAQDLRLVSTPDQPVIQGAIQPNQEQGEQNSNGTLGRNPGQQTNTSPASGAQPNQ